MLLPTKEQICWIYKIDFGAVKADPIDLNDRIFVHYIRVQINYISLFDGAVNAIGISDPVNQEHYAGDKFINVKFESLFETKEQAEVAVKAKLEDRISSIKDSIKRNQEKLSLYENALKSV